MLEKPRSFLMVAVAMLMIADSAGAHPLAYHTGGLAAGARHPLTGIDHILAMMAVGIVAAQRGGKSLWQLPLLFIGAMVVGGAIGIGRQDIPAVEQGVAASVLVLGLIVAVGARLPRNIIIGLIALFALFHGYAHGVELKPGLGPVAYAVGFVTSTAFLHSMGIFLGIAIQQLNLRRLSRIVGVAIAAVGLTLVVL